MTSHSATASSLSCVTTTHVSIGCQQNINYGDTHFTAEVQNRVLQQLAVNTRSEISS